MTAFGKALFVAFFKARPCPRTFCEFKLEENLVKKLKSRTEPQNKPKLKSADSHGSKTKTQKVTMKIDGKIPRGSRVFLRCFGKGNNSPRTTYTGWKREETQETRIFVIKNGSDE